MQKQRLLDLLDKFKENKCSKEELLELSNWYTSLKYDNQLIGENIAEIFSEEMLTKFKENGKHFAKRIPFYKKFYFKAVAAVIAIFLTGGVYFQFFYSTNNLQIVKIKIDKSKDISPGSNKAILTLADGTSILLDSISNGVLSEQGDAQVTQLSNGQLAYNSTNKSSREALYNSITTPIGGQYQLILSDGTKVWLNAASSIRFPVSFIGNERRVELTGEAYFEVTKNNKMPFRVDVANKGIVEVLGTHFNINAYTDESTINTTLLEGKVKVAAYDSRKLIQNENVLLPGKQAQLNSKGEIFINGNPDIEGVVAWKNGKFLFGENVEFEVLMRQIARWYGVEVEFKGDINNHIGGTISRNVNISKVLEMLEITGTVKFQINDKKITVLPNKK